MLTLPNEIQFKIITSLDHKDVYTLTAVNKQLKEFIYDEGIWKVMVEREFKGEYLNFLGLTSYIPWLTIGLKSGKMSRRDNNFYLCFINDDSRKDEFTLNYYKDNMVESYRIFYKMMVKVGPMMLNRRQSIIYDLMYDYYKFDKDDEAILLVKRSISIPYRRIIKENLSMLICTEACEALRRFYKVKRNHRNYYEYNEDDDINFIEGSFEPFAVDSRRICNYKMLEKSEELFARCLTEHGQNILNHPDITANDKIIFDYLCKGVYSKKLSEFIHTKNSIELIKDKDCVFYRGYYQIHRLCIHMLRSGIFKSLTGKDNFERFMGVGHTDDKKIDELREILESLGYY